jgi:hypothetical protein
MFAGSALAAPRPPPQPVYAVPPPVVVAPQPNVVYNPPQPYGGPQPPQGPTVVIDPVAEAAARLQSYHANSRIEGAATLGRLRDPRAIPPLVNCLKTDGDANVRIAAATALGEIGDPQAGIYLERVTIYDKKQKVRDAAAVALNRLPRGEAAPPQGQPVISTPMQAGAQVPSSVNRAPATPAASIPPAIPPLEPEPIERVPPPPTPSIGGPGFPGQP